MPLPESAGASQFLPEIARFNGITHSENHKLYQKMKLF